MNKELNRLFEAVMNNDMDTIEKYLLENPKLIEESDDYGVVPAFIAAKAGHYELVKYLMEYTRVSMNITDNENQSILHYAAMSDHLPCFRYLVERISMNPLEVNLNIQSPLDIAIKYQSKKIINYYNQVLAFNIENSYRNPIITGTYPDPSILRVGEDYYMVNSSFFLFPCIPIQHSKDLIHWHTIGHAITDTSYIDLTDIENGRGFWAPDISFSKGKFYITATLRQNDDNPLIRRQMIVSSLRAEGPYSQPKYIDVDGIDPSLFTDDDGKRYMLLNRGARIFEISHEGDQVLSEPIMLWYGANKRAPEAPHLLKKDGYYYCFVSEGGTGINHQISVARSKTLMGVYESCPYNPILRQNNSKHPIQRSGHGKLVETQNGEWYIAYLCGRRLEGQYSMLGRETSLDRVIWTEDGWPLINNHKGPSGVAIKPNLPEYIFKDAELEAFSRSQLSSDWVFVRTRQSEFYHINTEEKVLYLTAGKEDLNTLKARNVMLKRQKEYQFDTQVGIHFRTEIVHVEAGLTCYYDTDTFLKYYITKKENQYFLQVFEKIDEKEMVSLSVQIQFDGKVDLKIVTDYLNRTFYYKDSDGHWQLVGTLDNIYYLCDEGIAKGKRFTGAMIGIYNLDPSGSDTFVSGFKGFSMEGFE